MKKVNEVREDVGIEIDGDEDSVIMVDEKGKVIDGEKIMDVIEERWDERNRMEGGGIVENVM